MCQSIKRCAGQALAAEHFGPLLERQIGRDDHARTFVGRADNVEQQYRAGLAHRQLQCFKVVLEQKVTWESQELTSQIAFANTDVTVLTAILRLS